MTTQDRLVRLEERVSRIEELVSARQKRRWQLALVLTSVFVAGLINLISRLIWGG